MVRHILVTRATCPIIIYAISLISSVSTIYFGEVWLTVSSVANRDPSNHRARLFRQIELNWINAPLEESDDYIALYLDSEPDGNALPVTFHMIDGKASGQVLTDYYLPRIDFYNETNEIYRQISNKDSIEAGEESYLESATFVVRDATYFDGNRASYSLRSSDGNVRWREYGGGQDVANPASLQALTGVHNTPLPHLITARANRSRPKMNILNEECIGYCIAYHSRNKILAKDCLKTNPNWMADSLIWIGQRSLPTIMIPGTHNSGTYPHQLDKTVLQMINKYQINQDESVFNQLVYGIRYLDLRVGYSKVKNNPETLWIYHDIFRTDVSLAEVLDQIARFFDLTSDEIVIMDFHRFTVGFQNENIATQQDHHRKVVDLLFRKLDRYIIPSYLGQQEQLGEYIAMGKRLLIGYADRNNILKSLGEHSTYIGFYKQQQNDRIKLQQDQIQSNGSAISNEDRNKLQQQQEEINKSMRDDALVAKQSGKDRMGTRIFDRLKYLKVIRHSFSKRSIITPKLWNATDKLLSKSKSNQDEAKSGKLRSELALLMQQQTLSSRLTILFPSVRHLWPNKDTIEGLAQYMNDTTCRKYFDELRSLMVELTPTVFGAIADKYDGNRKLAQQVNRPVTDWIRDKWLHCVNIVASDFFLGNDLIRLAIESNKLRATNGNRVQWNLEHSSCKSMRRIGNLLDKSKIPVQFANQLPQGVIRQGNFGRNGVERPSWIPDNNNIVGPNGERISLPAKSAIRNHFLAQPKPQPRESKESLMDSLSDGLTDLFSSVKRLLSL